MASISQTFGLVFQNLNLFTQNFELESRIAFKNFFKLIIIIFSGRNKLFLIKTFEKLLLCCFLIKTIIVIWQRQEVKYPLFDYQIK